jgi:hypothetical protein
MSRSKTIRGNALDSARALNLTTGPWNAQKIPQVRTATVTLRRAIDERLELVCAENTQWHPGTYSAVPTADKPDF